MAVELKDGTRLEFRGHYSGRVRQGSRGDVWRSYLTVGRLDEHGLVDKLFSIWLDDVQHPRQREAAESEQAANYLLRRIHPEDVGRELRASEILKG